MRARALVVSALGLILLALLYVIAIPSLARRIPETLEDVATAHLQERGLDWLQVRAEGRDLLLRGQAPSSEAQKTARNLLSVMPGIRRLIDNMQLRAVSPYRMSFEWQSDRLTLSGYMPDMASLQDLRTQLSRATATLEQDIRVASGSPEGWSEAVAWLATAIPELVEARAQLLDQRLVVTGLTASTASRDRFITELQALKQSGYQVDAEVIANVTPYTLRLTKNATGLKIDGYVPDAASRRRMSDLLTVNDAKQPVQLLLREADGAPDGWMDWVMMVVDALPLLIDVQAEFEDRHLRLHGSMASTAQRDRFLAGLHLYEQRGYTLDLDLTAADADALRCQQDFDALLRSPILFATGGAQIGPASDLLLQSLAETALSCPDVRISIIGHTDNRGGAEANLRLSRERAEAVALRLIASGIDDSRISTSGRGSERPIANNDTAEGQAKNRRIEFLVEFDRLEVE